MWNFDYGFNNFNMFNFGLSTPSLCNLGCGQSLNFTPLFNFNIPQMPSLSLGSFGYTPSAPSATSTKPVTETKAEEAERINNLSTSTERIVEYNKKNYKKQYYGIVDKKTCTLKIYDKTSGTVVKTYTLGLGKDKGDGISGGKYTTAGEFTLDENVRGDDKDHYISKKDNKYKFMALRGDNAGTDGLIDGIHMVPNNLKSERMPKLESETIDDNRMSLGCINMTEDDYDDMYQYLKEGCKIYILPEEDGNELKLKKQKDGSYKFEQTYHQDDKRGLSKEAASLVIYDA